MAAYVEDDNGGDILFLAVVIAGGYFLYQAWRDHVAASIGGGVFESAAPSSDPSTAVLNYLVPLQISPTGAAYIKAQEQFRASPYADGGRQSIGWGHQIQPGDNIVPPITQAEGDSLFAGDLAAAEKTVSDGLKIQVSQNQFDALVDLAYNIGRSQFLSSTLLRLLNAGDYSGAAAQFGQWIHSSGHVNNALVARRQTDETLFTGG